MNSKHVLATNITSPTNPAAYMKKLTLNIDDLGLSPAVNEAVCRLAELRRIQSTSLMSLGELPHETLARLHASDCDIGLHLDLTGFAARQYPAVGGTLKQTLARAWLRRFEPTALRDLIRRQFDRFEDLTGHAPAFIDGHQHVHQFPQIRETLLAEAAARYPARPALRSTRPFARDHKSRLIHTLGGQHLDHHSDGWRKNRHFGGVYDFNPDAATLADHWQRWLAAAPDGSVIMCHPAVPGDDWQDDIKPARENEWRYLTSDAFAALWQNHACEAQRWAEIP